MLFNRVLQSLLLAMFGATMVRAAIIVAVASGGRHPVNPRIWLIAVTAEFVTAGLNLAASLTRRRALQAAAAPVDAVMAGLAAFAGVVTHHDREPAVVWSILAILTLIHLGSAYAAGRGVFAPRPG